MRWCTQSLIHYDRAASAWLILRFIDPDAKFFFVARDASPEEGVTLFGVQGADLAAHDGEVTTFQRILAAYALDDAALARVGRVIADGVDHVMHDPDRTALTQRDPYVGGVLALAEGVMLLSATDGECLQRSAPIYDALYTRFQAQIEIERLGSIRAVSVLEETVQFSKATRVLRDTQTRFSRATFAHALRGPSRQ